MNPRTNWPTRVLADELHRAEQWTPWQSDPAAIARIEMDDAKRNDRDRRDDHYADACAICHSDSCGC